MLLLSSGRGSQGISQFAAATPAACLREQVWERALCHWHAHTHRARAAHAAPQAKEGGTGLYKKWARQNRMRVAATGQAEDKASLAANMADR